MSKTDELRKMFSSRIREGLAQWCFDTCERELAERVRANGDRISNSLTYYLTDTYRLLELYDIVEWKRTRTRRGGR